MSYAVTLVASDKMTHPVTPAHANQIMGLLQEMGAQVTSAPSWLEQNKAVDLGIANCLSIVEIERIRELLHQEKIDVFCVELDHRRKKMICADMDSTIVKGETLDDLADAVGLKERISEITTRAMNGEIPFDSALRERVGLLKELPVSALQSTLDGIRLNAGAKSLIGVMRDHGAICVLVTGGFTFFAEPIAKACRFHQFHGNVLKIENDILTGRVQDPILDKTAKLDLLREYTYKHQMKAHATLAIGDGANDLPMLEAAGLGIGYHPKKLLREKLLNHVIHGDLTAILYAQGYSSRHMEAYYVDV